MSLKIEKGRACSVCEEEMSEATIRSSFEHLIRNHPEAAIDQLTALFEELVGEAVE